MVVVETLMPTVSSGDYVTMTIKPLLGYRTIRVSTEAIKVYKYRIRHQFSQS